MFFIGANFMNIKVKKEIERLYSSYVAAYNVSCIELLRLRSNDNENTLDYREELQTNNYYFGFLKGIKETMKYFNVDLKD